MLNPVLKRITYNPDAEWATGKEVMNSFVDGAVVSAILGAPGQAKSTINQMPVNVGQFTPSDWGKIVELQMYKDSGNATKEETAEIDEFTDEVNDALTGQQNGELTGEQNGDNVEVKTDVIDVEIIDVTQPNQDMGEYEPLVLKSEYSNEYSQKLINLHKQFFDSGYNITEHGCNQIFGRINQGKLSSVDAVFEVLANGTRYIDIEKGGMVVYYNNTSIHFAEDGTIKTIIGKSKIKSSWEEIQ